MVSREKVDNRIQITCSGGRPRRARPSSVVARKF